jgi:hypothetical protein
MDRSVSSIGQGNRSLVRLSSVGTVWRTLERAGVEIPEPECQYVYLTLDQLEDTELMTRIHQ